MIHTRAADDDTLAALAGFDGTVILHCFSSPALLEPALERGWYVSFAGNVTYPKAPELREAAARVPRDRILAETDSPYLAPQPVRGERNEPANVVHTLAVLAEARGEDADELAAQIDAQRDRGLRTVSVAPQEGARPALPGRREHPRRDRPPRGPARRRRRARGRAGPRRCSRATSPSTSRTSTRSRSTAASRPSYATSPNTTLHWRDALDARPAALEPAPNKLVANLPYNVATPIVVESLDALRRVELWCVMVQREVADRFFAEPARRPTARVSVLMQLVTERTGSTGLTRGVPSPAERRVGAGRASAVTAPGVRGGKRVVEGAFAHRRKTLPTRSRSAGSRRASRRSRAGGDRPRRGRPRRGARAARVRRAAAALA